MRPTPEHPDDPDHSMRREHSAPTSVPAYEPTDLSEPAQVPRDGHAPEFIDAYHRLSDDIAAHLAVLTVHRGRFDVAVTIDSYLDISHDPPTMALSLYDGARIDEAVDEVGTATLNLLSEDQIAVADRFGTPGNPLPGLFAEVPHRRSPAGHPILTGALAWFDLKVVARYPAATHALYVAEVSALGRGEEDQTRHSIRAAQSSAQPLIRWARRYRRLAP